MIIKTVYVIKVVGKYECVLRMVFCGTKGKELGV